MRTITGTTRVLALLGDPVSHSLSPAIQNAAIEALQLNGVYVALRASADDLSTLLYSLAKAGGGGNVTVPHKQRAAATVQKRTAAVERTSACNTFWLEDGAIWGDNTDVAGFAAAVRDLIGSPAGSRVLLLGAGGAARAALCALLDERADSVVVFNRTKGKAEEMRALFAHGTRRVRVATDSAALRREGFDLVVNATSLGLHEGDESPIDLAKVHRAAAALDLVYGVNETAWVRNAREMGIRAVDGREMLIRQGAAAFERWWGTQPPLEVMRKALETAATI